MENQLKIYNSLTRMKEVFEPLNPPLVGLYVCGPTVYNDAHLGNVRSAICFDVVLRYLTYLGYKVRYVRNITDVGHLLDDADEGEDKIAKRARLEKLEPMEIVQKYTLGYHKVMALYNNRPPSIEPRATGHIIEQIEMVQRIIANGYAYAVNGSVYFDVLRYNEDHPYGQLSGRKTDELLSNTRAGLEGQSDKKSPLDFAIWKKADKGHILRWNSPWGEGFPGWHLECSVMSTKYLGLTFDIHGGGMDLQFPHHECEIAQSVAADGENPVRYWMHNNMLTVNGTKMSKSLGNSFLPHELIAGDHELLEKGYSPMTTRFFMLQGHYSSPLDFSNAALQAAEKGYQRLMNTCKVLREMTYDGDDNSYDSAQTAELDKLLDEAIGHMNDDFNTPRCIASLFDLSKKVNSYGDKKLDLNDLNSQTFDRLKETYLALVTDVLGLNDETDGGGDNQEMVNGLMDLILDIRKSSREKKDWDTSDQIRNVLKTLDIAVKDGAEGSKWTVGS